MHLDSVITAIVLGLAGVLAACAEGRGSNARPAQGHAAPARLSATGLYADFAARTIAEGVLPFSPQYPLWTDGAAKHRWISLPAGTSIDAGDVDHWRFPVGTRLWKEFAFGDPAQAIETRYMELLADGSWLYASYLWTADGSDALLVPPNGRRNVCRTADAAAHDVPSLNDCRLCHENGRSPVLGFSALQLSPDRDPSAPHATSRSDDIDLPALVALGLLRNLDPMHLQHAPRIAARTPRERAALGYLHGNCSSCHNGNGPLARLDLRFDHPVATAPGGAPALTTTLGVASRFRTPAAQTRVVPGAPERSVVAARIGATDPLTQMPPFGRHLADRDAHTLVADWIREDLGPAAVSQVTTHTISKE